MEGRNSNEVGIIRSEEERSSNTVGIIRGGKEEQSRNHKIGGRKIIGWKEETSIP